MDVKAKVEEIVTKVKSDPKMMEAFKNDPVKTVEKLAGVDIPDNIEDQLVSGVKAKLTAGKLGDLVDKAKDLF